MDNHEFTPLSGDYGEPGQNYNLRSKFEERESDFWVPTNYGGKAYAEPFLALFISVSRKGTSEQAVTFHYGLWRSAFLNGLKSSSEDRAKLLGAAALLISSDLRVLHEQGEPLSTRSTIFVSIPN